MASIRAFVAIELAESLKAELSRVQEALKRQVSLSVAWTNSEGMHLTLKFLGDTLEEKVPEVIQALEKAAATGYGRTTLRLAPFGAFPSLNRPRVLWAGVAGDLEMIGALQRQVDQELAAIGFPPEEQPFRPHLTLGRVRVDRHAGATPMAPLRPHVEIAPLVQEVAGFSLMQSRLTPRGAIYTRLAAFPLARHSG